MSQTVTIEEGRAYVFVAVEHANSEIIGIHAARSANRFEALLGRSLPYAKVQLLLVDRRLAVIRDWFCTRHDRLVKPAKFPCIFSD